MAGGFFEITTESNLSGLTEMRNVLATSESVDNFTNTKNNDVNELVDKLKTVICDSKTETVESTSETKSENIVEPKAEPTVETKAEPTVEPKAEPTNFPKAEPTVEPKTEPTNVPKAEPTVEPSNVPSTEPAPVPTTESVSPIMNGGALLRGLLTESSLDLSSSDTVSSD